MNKLLLIIITFTLLATSCNTLHNSRKKQLLVEWYNVENLFDTIDNPHTADDEFTPESKKNWNTPKYNKKLKDLSNVIFSADSDLVPTFIGLGEVENLNVLKDLIAQEKFKAHNYKIIHFETSDARGIDVAMIYNADLFTPLEEKQIPLIDSLGKRYKTREILYVKGTIGKDTIHFYLNHWKSRRGGVEKTEYLRVISAKILRKSIDSVLNINPDANIICMGDFNDNPTNKSLNVTLNASTDSLFESTGELFNLAAYNTKKHLGTLSYKNEWFMLDNIIVTQNMLNKKNNIYARENAVILKNEINCYYNPKADDTIPNKTYGGKNYYGGVSDHFPIYVHFSYR